MQLTDWFSQAIQHRPKIYRLSTNTITITAFTWGSPTTPPVVLLHGGFANSTWYAHLAPHLAKRHFVIALDFSGHGQSDWRSHYTLADFFTELHTLYTRFSLTTATLIGHSFGARIAYHYTSLYPHHVSTLVLLDPPNIFHSSYAKTQPKTALRPQYIYPSATEILRRFRLIPTQPIVHPFIIDFIAKHAIVQTKKGYQWRTDLNLFNKLQHSDIKPPTTNISDTIPIILITGQHSTICPPTVASSFQIHHPSIQYSALPNAYHALMLDQPQALLRHLQTICNART